MTKRQADILQAIVEAYAENAQPVGSVLLAKIFKVASSTIRGEMYLLEKKGYLQQPHTSAGRIPTDKGYRWYVNQLQTAKEKSQPLEQFKVLGLRIQNAGGPEKMMKSAIDSLVELTSNASIGTLGTHLHTSGLGHLFTQPEFADKKSAQAMAYLLDNLEVWLREVHPTKSISVFIGQENPIGKTSGCSLIISRFSSLFSDDSYIGIIGSTRQNYKQTMALVEYTGQLLQDNL